MTNLTGKPPYQKTGKAEKAPGYIAALHQLPCVICDAFWEVQLSPTTAHHWICGRGQNTKTPDHEAIPLCDGHHQGTFDTSKVAIHRNREEWVGRYGQDHEYIQVTQDRMARLWGIANP